MPLAHLSRRFGNVVYRHAFPVYQPLYSAFKRYSDRVERQLLAQYLSSGSVVVDAGANIGIYAAFLSQRVGSNGVVHAFEPSEENFIRLCRTVTHLPNVRANQLAVSDQTGESRLYVSDELNVDHRAYPTDGEVRRTVKIRSTTLDHYFEPGAHVDLIKMDIQGFELHALRGAARVLDDNPRVALLLEFWPYGLEQAAVSAEELIAFLEDRGFVLTLPGTEEFERSHLSRLDRSNPSHYLNLFAKKLVPL